MCGNGGGGVLVVHGDADDLGAGEGEGFDLLDGGGDVGGVGVGHRLHDDGDFPADADLADLDRGGLPALNLGHSNLTSSLLGVCNWRCRNGAEAQAQANEAGIGSYRASGHRRLAWEAETHRLGIFARGQARFGTCRCYCYSDSLPRGCMRKIPLDKRGFSLKDRANFRS